MRKAFRIKTIPNGTATTVHEATLLISGHTMRAEICKTAVFVDDELTLFSLFTSVHEAQKGNNQPSNIIYR